MAYLALEDYSPHIKTELLNKLTEGDDTNRTKMELVVQEEMSMALAVRYEVSNIFSKSGDARNPLLVAMFVHMVIYRLANKLTPGQVSQQIRANYENAKTDLDNIASGKFRLSLPEVGDDDEDGDGDKSPIQWGAQTPRNPYY